MVLRTRTAAALAVLALASPVTACASSHANSAGSSETDATLSAAPFGSGLPGVSAANPGLSDQPLARVANLSGVHTQIALDPGFVAAVSALNLTLAATGKATLGGGTLTMPITGGHVSYYAPTGAVQPFVQGVIDHQGSGLALSGAGARIALDNLSVDPGAGKVYAEVSVNGRQAAAHADVFDLDIATLERLKTPTADTIVLQGAKVEISPDATQVFRTVFQTAGVQPNLPVGIATITIATGRSSSAPSAGGS